MKHIRSGEIPPFFQQLIQPQHPLCLHTSYTLRYPQRFLVPFQQRYQLVQTSARGRLRIRLCTAIIATAAELSLQQVLQQPDTTELSLHISSEDITRFQKLKTFAFKKATL